MGCGIFCAPRWRCRNTLPDIAIVALLERSGECFVAQGEAKETYGASEDYNAHFNWLSYLTCLPDNLGDEDTRPVTCGIFCAPRWECGKRMPELVIVAPVEKSEESFVARGEAKEKYVASGDYSAQFNWLL